MMALALRRKRDEDAAVLAKAVTASDAIQIHAHSEDPPPVSESANRDVLVEDEVPETMKPKVEEVENTAGLASSEANGRDEPVVPAAAPVESTPAPDGLEAETRGRRADKGKAKMTIVGFGDGGDDDDEPAYVFFD